MEGLIEWHFPDGGAIQLVADSDRAGRCLLRLGVDDLRRELAGLLDRGIESGQLDDTTSDEVIF